MYANRQILWHQASAAAARLRGVGWVHGYYRNTSTLSLVFQHAPEQSKSRIIRRPGQVPVLVHECQRKVLDRHQVVFSDDARAHLVEVIRPLIGDLFMQEHNLVVSFPLAVTAPNLPGNMALQAAQFGKALLQPARIVEQLPGRKSSQGLQANINAHLSSCWDVPRYRLRKFQHQAGIPAVIHPLDDSMFDHCLLWNNPVITHSDFPDALHIEALAALFSLAQLAAISIGEFDAPETVTAFEAREAGFLSGFQAAKESCKGFVQAAQQLLHAGSIQLAKSLRRRSTQVAKVRPLCAVAGALPRFFIDRDALFEGGIVDLSGLPEQEIQLFGLLIVRAKEVFVGAKHWLKWLLRLAEYQKRILDCVDRTIVPIISLFANKLRKEERASSAA
jgi:hypothetical protein